MVEVFPFLCDRNIEDVIWVRSLIENAPWTAGHHFVTKAWGKTYLDAHACLSPNGDKSRPLEPASDRTLRSRYGEYLKLPAIWEKIGTKERAEDTNDDSDDEDIIFC